LLLIGDKKDKIKYIISPPKRGSLFAISLLRSNLQSDELTMSWVLNVLRSISESFLFRIAKELDCESSLYEMPSSHRAVGVLPGCLCCPAPKRDEMSLTIPKLGLRTRTLLTVPLPVTTIPDAMN
jgi:hypothetical protein